MNDDKVTTMKRDDVEALIWAGTEWRGSSATMEQIMHAIDEYANHRATAILQAGAKVKEPVEKTKSVSVPLVVPSDVERARKALYDTVMTLLGSSDDPILAELRQAESNLVAASSGSKTSKLCRACGHVKKFDDFTRDRARADGYHSRCKQCIKAGIKISKS